MGCLGFPHFYLRLALSFSLSLCLIYCVFFGSSLLAVQVAADILGRMPPPWKLAEVQESASSNVENRREWRLALRFRAPVRETQIPRTRKYSKITKTTQNGPPQNYLEKTQKK